MTRNDPFGPAHEALRGVLAHLGAHAACEEALVLPTLAGLAPELAADLRAGHARLAGLELEVDRPIVHVVWPPP